MEKRWHKIRVNPIHFLTQFKIPLSHISFDSSIVKGITRGAIIRRSPASRHDGTSIFTYEIIEKVLVPIVYRGVFNKTEPPEKHEGEYLHYVLGWIHLLGYTGIVEINGNHWPGVRERASVTYVPTWKDHP